MYKHFFKRAIDLLLSFIGIIVLIPVWLILTIAIFINDPGPIFFTQKRVGKKKKLFKILKFRTMKTSTPHDMPTHMLENPEQYITKVGGFLRKTSLDELPQIFNIFAGQMSIIGPRPALWNQDDLIAERDKYGANDIKPGLTGWAQINGRDELEIPVKAKLDGEYVEKMSFGFDCKCFFGTIKSVLKHDGVVEGGTGELHKEALAAEEKKTEEEKEAEEEKKSEEEKKDKQDKQDIQSAEVAATSVAEETCLNYEIQTESIKKKNKIAVVSAHTPSLFWFRMDMMQRFKFLNYDVVAIANEPENEWKKKFAEYGIAYRQIYVNRNGTNPFKDVKTLHSIRKIFEEEKPIKVFSYNAKAVIYGGIAAKKLKIEHYPLIAGVGSVFLSNNFKNEILQKIMVAEYKKALKQSPAVFFQNHDDSELFLKKGIVTDRQIAYIHGSGVNLNKFRYEALPNRLAFLFVGRLLKDKGVREYLEASEKVKTLYPDVRFMLVGPFDTNPSSIKENELKHYVDAGIIEYYGEQKDVSLFLKQCSVFVLPSYREGTPKTVLEAMATGRAVITTDAPGCKETVIDGKNGYLIPVKNVDRLVEKMIEMIKFPDLMEEFGREGRKMAEGKFSVDTVNNTICKTMKLDNKGGDKYVTL